MLYFKSNLLGLGSPNRTFIVNIRETTLNGMVDIEKS
jgi:hypothetical protein